MKAAKYCGKYDPWTADIVYSARMEHLALPWLLYLVTDILQTRFAVTSI